MVSGAMPDELRPLKHHNYETSDDDALAREARQHVQRIATKQLVGELLIELRRMRPNWWTPHQLRTWWPASTRMLWLGQRPDVRQRITTSLTGLAPRAARKKAAYFQAELIDAVVNEGDATTVAFEEAFDPFDVVAYGPVSAYWRRFRAQVPLDDDDPAIRGLMGWLLDALLSEDGPFDGTKRKPILTAFELRSAIDAEAWHRHLPLEVRIAIDEARLRQEKVRPGRPFTARHDLRIATPQLLAEHLPLGAFDPVLDVAERVLGIDVDATQRELPVTVPAGPKTVRVEPVSVAPSSLIAPCYPRPVPTLQPSAVGSDRIECATNETDVAENVA